MITQDNGHLAWLWPLRIWPRRPWPLRIWQLSPWPLRIWPLRPYLLDYDHLDHDHLEYDHLDWWPCRPCRTSSLWVFLVEANLCRFLSFVYICGGRGIQLISINPATILCLPQARTWECERWLFVSFILVESLAITALAFFWSVAVLYQTTTTRGSRTTIKGLLKDLS